MYIYVYVYAYINEWVVLNIFAWQASQNVCAKHGDGQVSIIFPQWLDDQTQKNGSSMNWAQVFVWFFHNIVIIKPQIWLLSLLVKVNYENILGKHDANHIP